MGVDREELDKAVADARLDLVTGAAATTAGIALGASPILATVVGASGPALKFVHRFSTRYTASRQDRAAQAIEQAAEILGLDGLNILEERSAEDDSRLELLARVIEAAARTPLKEKITALGRVLAEGLREGGSVDESMVIAAALADVEAAHVVVLNFLAETPLPPEELRKPDHPDPRGWETSQMRQAVPEVARVLDGLVAVLSGHGLIRDQGPVPYPGAVGQPVWAVTELGKGCLHLLRPG